LEGGTLFISRKTAIFSWLESVFIDCGFNNVTSTSLDRDALWFKIIDEKPKNIFINSEFYSCVSSFMIGQLHEEFPNINISILNFGNFPDSLAVRFIYHGAKAYIDFNDGIEEFKNGLRKIKTGEEYYSEGVNEQINKAGELKKLKNNITDREWQVLFLVCNGFTDKEIIFYLSISKSTIDNHLNSLYKKLDVANRWDLIRKAVYLGWVRKEHLISEGCYKKIPRNPSKKKEKDCPRIHRSMKEG